jgi:type I restriction-modification system DNA methylase subunit
MTAPEKVKKLVAKFEKNIKAYKSSSYNEEQVKQEFINPFFEALGWDVSNYAGAAPQYRDVIFEDSIKVGKGTKAPDYCFTLAGRKMFFLEAKKPSVNIKDDKSPAYQVRRYAWSAKLSLSILTDFEELAVYESKTRPLEKDKASIGRITLYNYKDYIEKWDEIANIFSKEAVLQGSFDKFIEENTGKKGTSEVDSEFLKEIEEWRLLLARNIAIRNPEITVKELNYAVQQSIDRIIFLRMAEDRGIEPYEQLLQLLDEENIYKSFGKLCKKADDKYNSGLFHFKEEKNISLAPDTLTLGLDIDNGVFKTIIKNLYYPKSPYEFSVLSPEILGNVYEQFLGKVIRLTKASRAKVEEKPEVKKAGGVFYTPQYIVDYIVENTVGKLLEGKTPNQVAKLRIVDPACGSGSFLLGAYTYLLNWHRDYYSSLDKPPKNTIYKGKNSEYHLTIQKKKEILLNNIYGVDIDTQAVEVTKLSLLLKVLEDENKDALEQQQKLFQERVLPFLGDNIRCGNSLIATDILDDESLTQEEIAKINPFDWEDEFPAIFESGGFDAVIGNPPYGFHEIHHEKLKKYIKEHHISSIGSFEHYFLFYELSLKLLKNNGLHGFIVPVTWISIPSAKSLRKFVLENFYIIELDWFSSFVFKAKVNTLISIIKKASPFSTEVKIINKGSLEIPDEKRSYFQKEFIDENYSINIFENKNDKDIIKKMEKNTVPLVSIAKPCSGYNPYEKGKGKDPNGRSHTKETVKEKPYHSDIKESDDWKPEIKGRNLSRYYINLSNHQWVKYGPWLAAPRKPENFKGERILVQEITGGLEKRIIGAFYADELYYSRDVIPIKTDSISNSYFLLGLVNSRLITWYHHKRNPKSQKSLFPKVLVSDLKRIPIPTIDKNDKKCLNIISLSEKMTNLNKELFNAKTPHEKKLLEKQIEATDNKIDKMVYELYGLNKEEIAIVESSFD